MDKNGTIIPKDNAQKIAKLMEGVEEETISYQDAVEVVVSIFEDFEKGLLSLIDACVTHPLLMLLKKLSQ